MINFFELMMNDLKIPFSYRLTHKRENMYKPVNNKSQKIRLYDVTRRIKAFEKASENTGTLGLIHLKIKLGCTEPPKGKKPHTRNRIALKSKR